MIPEEYQNDFGFTAVSDPNLPVEQPVVTTDLFDEIRALKTVTEAILQIVGGLPSAESSNQIDSYQQRLQGVEKLVMPLLVNLAKDPEKEYILWPKRKEQVEVVMTKLIALTR